nr:immunoglobulin light chain junction region [Macaca mulatta]
NYYCQVYDSSAHTLF